jgi:hydroxymethylglutaryl-CoA lyase
MIKKVQIREMSVRDGLQNEKKIIPTAAKIELIQNLIDAGITYIEATAFVNPKSIPQMADAVEVAKQLPKNNNVTYSALVPNIKGLENALSAFDFKEIAVFTAASETFNQKNINTSIEGSFERFEPVIALAKSKNIRVRGYVSTAFVCPYEGKIKPEAVVPVIERLFNDGCHEVSIGDTIGKAIPEDVDALFKMIEKKNWIPNVAGHFHDTYGTALSNVLKCMEWGVSIFDSSAGGIGGCPYAPGAKGNVATETLVSHFDQAGIHTGINLQKLAFAFKNIQKFI